MKKKKISPLILAMGCTEQLMPDPSFAVSDDSILNMLAQIDQLDEIDSEGKTTLMYAALYERTRIVDYLLEHGADPNKQDHHKFTALHFAAQNGSAAMVNSLIKAGAKVNAVDEYGNTPIMRCKANAPFDVFQSLLENGADPFQKNYYDVSAYDMFCSNAEIRKMFAMCSE
jgi:ankyrin repeat protein